MKIEDRRQIVKEMLKNHMISLIPELKDYASECGFSYEIDSSGNPEDSCVDSADFYLGISIPVYGHTKSEMCAWEEWAYKMACQFGLYVNMYLVCDTHFKSDRQIAVNNTVMESWSRFFAEGTQPTIMTEFIKGMDHPRPANVKKWIPKHIKINFNIDLLE